MRWRPSVVTTVVATLILTAGLLALPATAFAVPTGQVGARLTATTSLGPGAGFTAVSPRRVLDTRNATGGPKAPLGAGATRVLDLSGVVPAGTSAVVMNVTATDVTTSGTVVTVWPDGVTRPNLESEPGQGPDHPESGDSSRQIQAVEASASRSSVNTSLGLRHW
jgi:hypothetical protein